MSYLQRYGLFLMLTLVGAISSADFVGGMTVLQTFLFLFFYLLGAYLFLWGG